MMLSSYERSRPYVRLASIAISFIIASVVNVYPLAVDIVYLRPLALVMVLIYWLIFAPDYVGVLTAFTVGLLSDFLLSTTLGQQALSAVMAALVIKVSSLYVKQLNAANTWIIATLSLCMFQFSLFFIRFLLAQPIDWYNMLTLLTSIVMWPFLMWALSRFSPT